MALFCVSIAAGAQDVHCPPSMGAVEVDGNLLIAAPCELSGTRVRGNVRLFAGGALNATRVRIEGNLDAERADFVRLTNSQVEGNLVLEELVGDHSSIELSEIDGNVRVRRSRSRVDVADNLIDGNVEFHRNDGLLWIAANRIDGDLTCRGNDQAPAGHLNQVSGSIRGQCRTLQTLGDDRVADEADGIEEEHPAEEPVQEPAPPADDANNVPPPAGPGGQSGPSNPQPPGASTGGSTGSSPTGGSTSPSPVGPGDSDRSTALTLDPQPSGGGGAAGPVDLALLMVLLSCGLLLRHRAHASPNQARRRALLSRRSCTCTTCNFRACTRTRSPPCMRP